MDMVGDGAAGIIGLASPDLADEQEGITNSVDVVGTSESAALDEQLGSYEVELGTPAGDLVPSNLNGAEGGAAKPGSSSRQGSKAKH